MVVARILFFIAALFLGIQSFLYPHFLPFIFIFDLVVIVYFFNVLLLLKSDKTKEAKPEEVKKKTVLIVYNIYIQKKLALRLEGGSSIKQHKKTGAI
jgi:hypothetical protein